MIEGFRDCPCSLPHSISKIRAALIICIGVRRNWGGGNYDLDDYLVR
jgi:hypothetical protein